MGAPIGVHVRVLPAGYSRIAVGGSSFFLSFGTYYRFDSMRRDYVVVPPPPNAPPPPGMDQIVFNDGQSVFGMFDGASSDSVDVTVEGTPQRYAINSISAIHFAPPTGQ